MHAEFSSQLINYAVLTLATVSFSLCKHEAAQNGKGVGRAPAEMREQRFQCWVVFTLTLRAGSQDLFLTVRFIIIVIIIIIINNTSAT